MHIKYHIHYGALIIQAPDHSEMAKRRFEMPMVKRYLPMYQSPELIEELKRHDRMRLVQEREAKRSESPCPSSDSISTDIKKKDRRIDRFSASGPSVSIQVTLYMYFKNDRTRTSFSGKVEHVYSKTQNDTIYYFCNFPFLALKILSSGLN